MLYHDLIDISKEIDFNKASALKDPNICHFWYLLDKGLKFQPYVCSGCHDVLMMSISLSDIAILNIHGVDCRRSEGKWFSRHLGSAAHKRCWNIFPAHHIFVSQEIKRKRSKCFFLYFKVMLKSVFKIIF